MVQKRTERKATMKVRREEWVKKAKSYAEANRAYEQSLIKERRTARGAGNFFVPAEAKVAFIVRLKG